MKNKHMILPALLLVCCFCAGCATTPPQPVAYLAVKKPEGVIKTNEHAPVTREFSRGGWYFGNSNFRPAPDPVSYIEEASRATGADILRNADVKMTVPFVFDILFFGYNQGTDTLTAIGK